MADILLTDITPSDSAIHSGGESQELLPLAEKNPENDPPVVQPKRKVRKGAKTANKRKTSKSKEPLPNTPTQPPPPVKRTIKPRPVSAFAASTAKTTTTSGNRSKNVGSAQTSKEQFMRSSFKLSSAPTVADVDYGQVDPLVSASYAPDGVNTRKIRYEENQAVNKALISTSSRMGRTVLKDPRNVTPDMVAYGTGGGFGAMRAPADYRPVAPAFPFTSVPSAPHLQRSVAYPEELIDFSRSDFASTQPVEKPYLPEATRSSAILPPDQRKRAHENLRFVKQEPYKPQKKRPSSALQNEKLFDAHITEHTKNGPITYHERRYGSPIKEGRVKGYKLSPFGAPARPFQSDAAENINTQIKPPEPCEFLQRSAGFQNPPRRFYERDFGEYSLQDRGMGGTDQEPIHVIYGTGQLDVRGPNQNSIQNTTINDTQRESDTPRTTPRGEATADDLQTGLTFDQSAVILDGSRSLSNRSRRESDREEENEAEFDQTHQPESSRDRDLTQQSMYPQATSTQNGMDFSSQYTTAFDSTLGGMDSMTLGRYIPLEREEHDFSSLPMDRQTHLKDGWNGAVFNRKDKKKKQPKKWKGWVRLNPDGTFGGSAAQVDERVKAINELTRYREQMKQAAEELWMGAEPVVQRKRVSYNKGVTGRTTKTVRSVPSEVLQSRAIEQELANLQRSLDIVQRRAGKEKKEKELLFHTCQILTEQIRKLSELLQIPTSYTEEWDYNSRWYELKTREFTGEHIQYLEQLRDATRELHSNPGFREYQMLSRTNI
ncbi:hypothetical protein BLNAU_12862 [Blattamonas nauphoetae]|uniref:Uncharacterized protein n=1 Tax=Blattamonas nauphoetae TaxID=2049346 RepID=A0ABQ9XKB4_9EUKA|nr:hypothetical protein BLNAU_12862 [Blattamonas nauphoetae]